MQFGKGCVKVSMLTIVPNVKHKWRHAKYVTFIGHIIGSCNLGVSRSIMRSIHEKLNINILMYTRIIGKFHYI